MGIPEKRDARSALAGRSFRLKRDTRCKKLLTEQWKTSLPSPLGYGNIAAPGR